MITYYINIWTLHNLSSCWLLVVDQLSETNDDKMLEIKCVANVLLFELSDIFYNFHIKRPHKLNYSSNMKLCCLTPVMCKSWSQSQLKTKGIQKCINGSLFLVQARVVCILYIVPTLLMYYLTGVLISYLKM